VRPTSADLATHIVWTARSATTDLRGRAELSRQRALADRPATRRQYLTSPTAIGCCAKVGPEEPKKYDYHFKHMTTVGEPIEPEVWRWYHSEVGKGEAAIVDTWWQTETGGFLGSTLPALQPMKPGSCGPGVLGIYPVVYEEDAQEVPGGSGRAGNICIRNPWPGIMQTIWGQPERFIEVYYAKCQQGPGEQGLARLAVLRRDGALQAADGYQDPRPGRRCDQRGGPPARHQDSNLPRSPCPRSPRQQPCP
jgi:acyl-coenzyme A synthetase/AMP-(fatty) acid ligase